MAISRYPPDPYPGRDVSSAPPIAVSVIPNRQRQMLVVAGCGLLGMLVIARWIEPDPAGYGTHRQLGFPPCTVVRLWGEVCPTCGMTTAWALVVRGQLMDAITTNAGGTLLAIGAILMAPWLLVSSARGKWWLVAPKEKIILILIISLVLITILDWIRRIYF